MKYSTDSDKIPIFILKRFGFTMNEADYNVFFHFEFTDLNFFILKYNYRIFYGLFISRLITY